MTEPHPLRCETCNVKKCRYNPKNEDEGILLGYSWVKWHIDEFGCASHSNNTSAEKVLDIIRKTDSGGCPHKGCRSEDGHDGINCRDCLIRGIEGKLRQERDR